MERSNSGFADGSHEASVARSQGRFLGLGWREKRQGARLQEWAEPRALWTCSAGRKGLEPTGEGELETEMGQHWGPESIPCVVDINTGCSWQASELKPTPREARAMASWGCEHTAPPLGGPWELGELGGNADSLMVAGPPVRTQDPPSKNLPHSDTLRLS